MPHHTSYNAGAATASRTSCAYCGRACSPHEAQGALIPDSSAIDPEDPARDGGRYVHACSVEHMTLLLQQARNSWNIAELWFGRLCRTSSQVGMRDATVEQLAVHARLSPQNLQEALAWNAGRKHPLVVLPGGQILPLST